MNLKQLLSKVDFDDVAPFIVQHYPELAKCMAGFKMTFDGMRNTVSAKATDEQITVELCEEEGEEPYLTACHSDNDVWKNVVGRKVIIKDNVKASLEEITAVILFDATYWGFTPDDRDETFEEWDKELHLPANGNPYRKRWWILTQREHDSLCDKEDIGKRTYTADLKHPFKCLSDKPMSRIKRMRAHRWEKRIEELDRLANRWDLLQKIKCSVPQADLTIFEIMLFKTPRCEVSRFADYSADGMSLSYIYELITKYAHRDFDKANKTLLWVQSPNNIDTETMKSICAITSNPNALVASPQIISEINASEIERTKLTIIQLFA